MAISEVGPYGFLAEGGDAGALMRVHDWSQSPLGPLKFWPQPLCSVVDLLLGSKFPMFIAWGPDLVFLYNDSYAQILGAKHPGALGRRFQDVWPEIWDDVSPIVIQAIEGNATYHENLPLTIFRHGHDEQAWFSFSYSPARDESGNVAGVFCVVMETTSQVMAERHRTAEYEHMRRLFQQAPGIIAVLREPNHIIEIANDAFLRLIGRDNVLGKTIREVLPEVASQGFFELLDNVFQTGKPYIAHEALVKLQRRPGGPLEERFVNFVYQPTLDYQEKITGIFVEGNDVTEAVHANRALRYSEDELTAANRRKDEFLAMLAHELRNPLAPIATAAELLKLAPFDEARVRKTSEVISRQVAHMTELVDDLLDISRVTRGLITLQQETMSISSVLVDAVEQTHALIETKRHHFNVRASEEQFIVKGDRTRLVQVFSNLLNNAAKYTPPEGHIILRVEGREDQVEVTVEDDGVGVAPSLQPHIFDLFTQAERTPDRAQGGLGLGLALVKSLVELQGGQVSVHSEGAGKGSVFTVSLPRERRTNSQPERQSSERRIPQSAKAARVLIVDDNKDAVDMLSLLLQTLGHDVSVAYNPFDALTVAKQMSPAVLFVDIGLPDIDGFELARRLRAIPETAHSLLVALTGYGQPQDKEHAIRAGFDHYLVKPVNLSQVVELLAKVA